MPPDDNKAVDTKVDDKKTDATADLPAYDAFSEVFSDITKPVDASKKEATDDVHKEDEIDEAAKAAAKPAEDDKKDDNADDKKDDVDPNAKADDKKDDAAGGEGGGGDGAGGTDGDDGKKKDEVNPLQAQVDRLQADLEAERASRTTKAEDDTKKKEDEAPPEIYSPEEKTFLGEYAKEWPDIVKGEALRRRGEYRNLVSHIFTEVAKVYNPLLERALQTTDQVSEDTALALIRTTHADYNDEMHDSIVKWADELPGFRKKVAQATIKEGETQDVIDLISDWKQATGKSKPKVVVDNTAAKGGADNKADAATPGKKNAPLTPQAKQAAAAMAARDSKRSVTGIDTPDAEDFDAAWGEATK